MATAYNVLQKIQQAREVDRNLLVPDSNSVIPVNPTGMGVAILDTAGTYTLESEDAVAEGTMVIVNATTSGITVEGNSLANGEHEVYLLRQDSSGDREWAALSSAGSLDSRVDDLEADVQKAFTVDIPLTLFRVHDAFNTNLPATAGTDDLGLTTPTIGTDTPLMTADLSDATGTQEALGLITIPENYQAGDALSIVIPWTRADAATDSMTLDLTVWRVDDPTTDINTTAAVDVNSAASGTATFVLTADDLSPGDSLLVNILVAIDDTTTGTGDGASVTWDKMSWSYTV